jgi:hypothetical protein
LVFSFIIAVAAASSLTFVNACSVYTAEEISDLRSRAAQIVMRCAIDASQFLHPGGKLHKVYA